MALLDLDKLHVEDECGIRRNGLSGTLLTISQRVGDEETVFGAFLHKLQALCPALDDLVEAEGGCLSALVAAVEDLTVDECTLVVALHLVSGCRPAAVALAKHLIL